MVRARGIYIYKGFSLIWVWSDPLLPFVDLQLLADLEGEDLEEGEDTGGQMEEEEEEGTEGGQTRGNIKPVTYHNNSTPMRKDFL